MQTAKVQQNITRWTLNYNNTMQLSNYRIIGKTDINLISEHVK